MDLKELKNDILKNKGGTYTKDIKHADKRAGYYVSVEGYEVKTYDINKVCLLVNYYSKTLNNAYYIGVWYNAENKLYYIDASRWYNCKEKAIASAKRNHQLAIFEIRTKRDIRLDYNVPFVVVYKTIKNALGEIINEIPVGTYETLKDASIKLNVNYDNLKKNKTEYTFYKTSININELVND